MRLPFMRKPQVRLVREPFVPLKHVSTALMQLGHACSTSQTIIADLVYIGPPSDERYLDYLEENLSSIERSGRELRQYVQEFRARRKTA